MFQICNLENNIYSGRSGNSIEDNINVLDYDDLTIETVNFDLCVPLFRSSFVALTAKYGFVVFLAYLDHQDYNDLIKWDCYPKAHLVKLTLRDISHKIRLKTYVIMPNVDRRYYRLKYDSTCLFECDYFSCELHVNYAFRYNSYIILRLTVYTLGLRGQITPVYSFSLVFRDEVLLGLYMTYASLNNYRIVKPISTGLEAKLMFFFKDKW